MNKKYLDRLRRKHGLLRLTREAKKDFQRVLLVLHWVHSQWRHSGNEEPKKNDALSILEEAKQGKNFRCVEYGIVAAGCLNSIGLKTRRIALKTRDVETRESGAGHVAAESFLNDLKKWIFLDPQWDIVPMLAGVPLNAVEFQKAIAKNCRDLEIESLSKADKVSYIDWIYPYLYYMDVSFDNRAMIRKTKPGQKSKLMLVPIGAKEPKLFQRKFKIDYCHYTSSLADFYSVPYPSV